MKTTQKTNTKKMKLEMKSKLYVFTINLYD